MGLEKARSYYSPEEIENLTAYFHWDDLQGLEQAVWVVEQNEFDMESVGTWTVNENKIKKFEIFRNRVDR